MPLFTRALVVAVASFALGVYAVLSATEEGAFAPAFIRDEALSSITKLTSDDGLLAKQSALLDTSLQSPRNDTSLFLVVGIKTSVIHHFAQRQAIRETWANASQLGQIGVRVVFLGCDPDLSHITDEAERATVADAIAREKGLNNDLLTSELDCVDSYEQLLRKTVQFFHWVDASLRGVHYVMIADDDVYVDIAHLIYKLRQDAPTQRLYAGYVFKDLKPQRDPTHKNVIPENVYPMSKLPPFAGGPHYVMSLDVVRYIARNRNMLRGLRALDDVSIALWLLALQIHPVHFPEFVLLRTSPCHERAIALADLSLPAIRQLHVNTLHNRSRCEGLVGRSALCRHRSIVLPKTEDASSSASDSKLTWEISHNASSYALHVGVTVTVAKHEISYDFIPSAATYDSGLCQPGARLLFARLYVTVDSDFCQYHRRKLLAFMTKMTDDNHGVHAILALPRHNLVVPGSAVKTVGLSRGARYARTLVECLLVEVYPTYHILVLDEDTLGAADQPSPDLFVFSVLPEDSSDDPNAPQGARFLAQYGAHSQMLMVSGEAWLPYQLDPQVTLITTLAHPHHPRQIYLPVASTVFGEIAEHTPVDLLRSYVDRNYTDTPRRFCAYLYARCDRLRREYMFDLLNEFKPVDALGACQGAKRAPKPQLSIERYKKAFYTDLAIAKYSNYKFVIAFENTFMPGYVTEKIVTAFLAGAIPIYYGHSSTVNTLFNRDAFINCADYDSLRACAQRVILVDSLPAEYEAMRRAAPISNRTAFLETFSWHPEVRDVMPRGISRTAKQLKQILEQTNTILS